MNIECYSEESDDDDEAEVSVEDTDQLTPGSLRVSIHTLSRHANINSLLTVIIKRQHSNPLLISIYMYCECENG